MIKNPEIYLEQRGISINFVANIEGLDYAIGYTADKIFVAFCGEGVHVAVMDYTNLTSYSKIEKALFNLTLTDPDLYINYEVFDITCEEFHKNKDLDMKQITSDVIDLDIAGIEFILILLYRESVELYHDMTNTN